MIARAPSLALLATLGALSAIMGVPSVAHAAPGDYKLSYDWSDPQVGYVGWSTFEVPDIGAAGFRSPFYASRLAPPELRIATSPAADGTRDRLYPQVDQDGPRRILSVQAPGSTRIRSATFRRIDSLRGSGDRQFVRLAVYGEGAGGTRPDNVYDFRPDTPPRPGAPGMYESDRLYQDVGPVTVDPDEPGRSAQVWLLTSCDPSCPTVTFNPDGSPRSYGQVQGVDLDLFDPEPPSITASGALTQGDWTNARDARTAQLVATDPGSGVSRVTVSRRRQGGSVVTVLDRPVSCDRGHVTGQEPGRLAAPCPALSTTGLVQPLSALPDGIYTFTARAEDDAQRDAETQFTTRLDSTRPGSVAASGEVRSTLGRWTNRRGPVSVRLRASDVTSGVQRIELHAVGAGGDRLAAVVRAPCASGCPRSFNQTGVIDYDALPDGRQTLVARAFDAAGNVNERRIGDLQLDRVAPGTPRGFLQPAGSQTLLKVQPQIDTGSGIAGFRVSYEPAGQALPRSAAFRASVSQQFGTVTDYRLPLSLSGNVDVFAQDRAGNVSPSLRLAAQRRCVEALVTIREAGQRERLAKIGEVRAGVDTKGVLSYARTRQSGLDIGIDLSQANVGIKTSKQFESSTTGVRRVSVSRNQGYNVARTVYFKEEVLREELNGRRSGKNCPRTVGPRRVFSAVGEDSGDLPRTRMPSSQFRRADCNDAARWQGKRRQFQPDGGFTKTTGETRSFSRGVSVLGLGVTTSTGWATTSSVGYDFGQRYRAYWLCGDGGRRDAGGNPDPETWSSMFGAAKAGTAKRSGR